jgi:hypothetical protein
MPTQNIQHYAQLQDDPHSPDNKLTEHSCLTFGYTQDVVNL